MLTERQELLLDFVRDFQSANSVPPSMREIGRRFDCTPQTVMKHLQALARKGQLEKLADGKWGLKARAVQSQLFEIPVYGSIPAGLPAMNEQEPDERLSFDPGIFGIRNLKPGHFWFLRVKGDSMTGAGVLDGDLVALVRREPKVKDIIAALVDETTTTLKRLVRERGRWILRAENPRYPDIVPERLESQGVMVGVLRRNPA